MNNYNINIVIYNKHGELLDTRYGFDSLDVMRTLDINKLVNEAEDYGKESGMLIEELYDSKEEYLEDLTENSPLNNPANFAN